MFRSFVYLDEEKLYSYLKQIDKDFVNRPMEVNTKRAKGGSIGLSSLNLTAGTETEEKRSYEKDVFNDYDRFEKDLEKLEASEYFDFVLNSGYDLKSLPKMCIIRFDGRFEIPEQFDMYSVAQAFMPLITSQIQTSSDDEKEILEAFLGKASADIPFLVEDEDVVISGKLNTNNLFEAYSELEEYTEQDVFMLCKVIGVMNKEKVEVFNPLKDFIKLPRAVRRGMDEDSKKGLESICVDGPVLKVEVIAMYK